MFKWLGLLQYGSGYLHGKGDSERANNAITQSRDSTIQQSGAGIGEMQNRINTVQPRSDAERAAINSNFSNFAATGGISDGDWAHAMGQVTGDGSSGGGGSSSGGGGGGGSSSGGTKDYLDTFRNLQTDEGAFDPARMKDITDTISRLKNSGNNYTATDKSIGGLQDFAASGGVSAADANDIQGGNVFRDMAATGGYSDSDLGNIRRRSNASIGDTYTNLAADMKRRAAASGNFSPGMGASGFKLARQSAQDIGTNASNTEVALRQAINANKMQGAGALSSATQGLAGLRSSNTLSGYTNAGQLDEGKQKAIEDALAASGGLDLNTQQLLNNTKLAATSGLSQDALGRASIGASSAAAQNALNAANARFLLSSRQQGQEFGSKGLLDTYGTAPAELMGDQNLLFNYRGQMQNGLLGAAGLNTNLAGGKGWMDSLGGFGSLAGGAGSALKAYQSFSGGNPGGGEGGGYDDPGDLEYYNPGTQEG